jgi:hypothetical protein
MHGGHFRVRWNNAIASIKSHNVSSKDNNDDSDDDMGDECLYVSA